MSAEGSHTPPGQAGGEGAPAHQDRWRLDEVGGLRPAGKKETQQWQEHFSCRPRGTPEHLRQTTQQRRGWNSGGGHEPGTHESRFLLWNLSTCNSSPSPFHLLLVSWCFFVFVFFKNLQFDFSSFIEGKTSDVVFLWKYISIIYIYFLQISQSTASPAGQERILAEGIRFLFFLPRGSGLFLLQLGLG